MVDNLHSGDGLSGQRRSEPGTPPRTDNTIEREVAITGVARPAVPVQQWLDGEGTEAAARRANAREVDLWSRINDETDRRSRMTTPAPVMDRIMSAIPATAPATPTPWWARSVSVSPAAMIGAGAGLLALGAVLGALVG